MPADPWDWTNATEDETTSTTAMRSIARLLPFLRPYPLPIVLSLASLAILVVFDLAIPRLVQHLIDDGVRLNDADVVLHTALGMLAISASSALIALVNNSASIRVGEGVARDLRAALFAKIQTYSFADLDRQKTGPLLVRLTSDVAALKSLVQISLRIGTRAPLMMIGSLALMIHTSATIALTLVPVLVVTAVLLWFFVTRMEPLFRVVQQKLDGMNAILQENVAGVRVVKSLVRADYEGARFADANESMTKQSVLAMRWMSSMSPALVMCINAGVVVVLWFGGNESIEGRLSLGQIVAFTNYLFTTMTPLVMMTMLANTWASGLASARRVDEIFATVPDVRDAPNATALARDVDARIELHDVDFHYGGERAEAVLRDIELVVEPGTTVAVLGATGAGKTSLIDLVPRFYDPTKGVVMFGGVDVKAVTGHSLLARISLVPQESVLFSGTIRDNIRYGRPDAKDDDVIAAAKLAQADDFIRAMPNGYDSAVAQRGANLSGGQKQRLAIARALLVDPDVLILDDSTASVDVETESRIQDALASQHRRRTTIVVAQRISTVLNADKIVVLDKGRIVAAGTHRALLEQSAVYREIYESQLGPIDPAPALVASAPGRGDVDGGAA
jgi:ATP-binding cassette subfamily B protein